jgi:hypothetical protein
MMGMRRSLLELPFCPVVQCLSSASGCENNSGKRADVELINSVRTENQEPVVDYARSARQICDGNTLRDFWQALETRQAAAEHFHSACIVAPDKVMKSNANL